MNGEFDFQAPSPEKPEVLTVSDLTLALKRTIEPKFAQVWVQGEISNFRPSPSGHLYFSLKDNQSVISAVSFGHGKRSNQAGIREGASVLCKGRIAIYAPRGNYQIVVEHMQPLGAGALQVAFEKLKASLLAEGLFEASRKKKLPRFPRTIGLVTSPTGAALQDMLNVFGRLAPHVKLTVFPTLVQGDEAPPQIIRALEQAQLAGVDVVILARGGGSLEDLWAFNNEALARAIAACGVPTISAIGHEVDFSISDFVADVRAPTPSAAAEIVCAEWVQVGRRVTDLVGRLRQGIARTLEQRRLTLSAVMARLVSPKDRLRERQQRCDELSIALERGIALVLERRKNTLGHVAARLGALSPLGVLGRGYSIVRREDGTVVRSASSIETGAILRILLNDGEKLVRALQSPSNET